MPAFRLVWTGDILKNYLFENDGFDRVFLNYKMTGDCSVFKFLQRSVDGERLIRFQSETSVFKFLQYSTGGD